MADHRSPPRRKDSRRSEYAVDPSSNPTTYIQPRMGTFIEQQQQQPPASRMQTTSYDAEPPRMRGAPNERELSSSSSSSSSYLDISRTFPNSAGNRILTFFKGPSERRRVRRRRSRKGLFKFGNNSSSSIVNEDLAYGTGFIKVPKSRVRKRDGKERGEAARVYGSDREGKSGQRGSRTSLSRTYTSDREVKQSDREGGRTSRSKGKLSSAATNAEILALGAGLAKIARDQNKVDLRPGSSRNGNGPELVAVRESGRRGQELSRGLGPSKISHGSDTHDEDGWESASDDESDSSVDSKLAYGDMGKSSGWSFFGRRKQKPLSRKNTVVDPEMFGPQNTLKPFLTKQVGFGEVSPWSSITNFGQPSQFEKTPIATPGPSGSYSGSQVPLRQVFPMPTDDPTRFEPGRGSVVSEPRYDPSRNSSARDPTPLISSRPDPIPIQQPQPFTPVSQNVYDSTYRSTRDEPSSSRNTPSSSRRSKSLAEKALAGVAIAAVGATIASNRDDRKDRRREEEHEEKDRLKRREMEREEQDLLVRRERERGERRRADELAELEKERLKRRESEKRDSKDDRRRDKRSEDDDRKDKRRDKDRKKDDADDGRRDKKRDSKRRDETQEEKEERREKRRSERSDRSDVSSRPGVITDFSRSEERPDPRRTMSEASVAETAIDPFQYQVSNCAFPTPTTEDALGYRSKEPEAPKIFTVEREPDFSRMRSSSIKDQPSGSRTEPKRDYDDLDDRGRDRDRTFHEGEEVYDEIRKSTAPYDVAVIGAADAAVHAEDARKRRRDYDYNGRDKRPTKKRDPIDQAIQDDADRAYREIVMARKIASQVIRSRSPSPDRSVVDKYDQDEKREEIQIVTPPGMEDHKKKGPYDAPNADFRLDYVLEHPRELRTFNIPAVDLDHHSSPDTPTKRDPDADRPRPFLNLVMPTPTPSPALEKQEERSRSSKPRDRGQPQRRPSVDDISIGPKGNVVASPSSSPTSTTSKGVTWGENETKHYEIESHGEHRDEFVAKAEVQPRDAPAAPESKPSSKPKSKGWGAIAAGIIGAGAGAAAANSGVRREKFKENEKAAEVPYEYRGVVVEPETESPKPPRRRSPPSNTRPGEEPASPPLRPRQDSPPSTGPKPTRSSHIPGAFDDDLDFTAHVAAGLQDTGFDPNIVINDPTFRRRDSPPGSNVRPFYQTPYAETVTDLGSIPAESGSRGMILGEVAETPRDWNSVSPAPELEETPKKLSKKEQKKRDKERRQSGDATPAETSTRDIIEEPEAYFEPKLSKKEQKKRERENKTTNVIEEITPSAEVPAAVPVVEEIVEEPESYFVETAKKSKKKSKRSSTYDDDVEDSPRDSRTVTVPVDAFDDIQNGEDDWVDTKKSKKKSKRDSERFDSPIRSAPTSEVGSSELERSSSKTSKRRSEQFEPEPTEVSLPPSTPSEVSRDGDFEESRKSRKSSSRDSGIFDSADRGESRSVMSASRYEDDTPKKKKKSRSGRDDFDDTRSVASAPAGDDWDDKKSKKKEKEKDPKKSSGIWGLFSGSKSESGAGDESPKRSKDDLEDAKKKKKSKRSSVPDGGSIYGDVGAMSTQDLSRSVSNGNGNGSHHEDGYEDGTRSDGERSEKKKKSRSRSGSVSSSKKDKDSFLGNTGTLGAGAGIAGAAAVAIAQHRSQSKAATARSSEVAAPALQRPNVFDYEVTERPYRPSIDPQYGDLLPLPPSDPVTPEIEPLESLPELPDSRPETPEDERTVREKSMSAIRKNMQETPIKSPNIKSPSHSTVPLALRFASANRSSPSSPGVLRSSPAQSPATPNPDSLSFPRPRSRPASWEGSTEYKPLYLVETNRRDSTQLNEKHEDLPALPESSRTSRSSSHPDLDRGEDFEQERRTREFDPLSIDTALASAALPELLGSEQSTPKAGEHNIDSIIEDQARSRSVSPTGEPKSHALRNAGIAAAATLAGASVFDYLTSDREESDDMRLSSDELPSIARQPFPVDPVTKDRSSYLLKSSPMSRKQDDSPTDQDAESPTGKGKDRGMLHSIEEREGSDIFSIPDDVRAEREKALGILSGPPSPEATKGEFNEGSEPIEEFFSKKSKKDKKKDKKGKASSWSATQDDIPAAEVSREMEPETTPPDESEPFEEFTVKKSKKDKKKGKGSSRSPARGDFDFPESTSKEVEEDFRLLTESEQVEDFSMPKSKKDKKKDTKKGKSPLAWDAEADDSKDVQPAAEPESIPDVPAWVAIQQAEESIAKPDREDAESSSRDIEQSDEFSTPKSKKDKKKDKKKYKSGASWDDEEPIVASAVSDLPATTPEETPKVVEPDQDDDFSAPKSKKDKKKDKKKSKPPSSWEPDETTSFDAPMSKNLADDPPAPSETTSEDFIPTAKSKKDKRKKRKSVTFSEPGDDDQFSDLPKEPWFESGREFVNEPVSILKEPSWNDKESFSSPELYHDSAESPTQHEFLPEPAIDVKTELPAETHDSLRVVPASLEEKEAQQLPADIAEKGSIQPLSQLEEVEPITVASANPDIEHPSSPVEKETISTPHTDRDASSIFTPISKAIEIALPESGATSAAEESIKDLEEDNDFSTPVSKKGKKKKSKSISACEPEEETPAAPIAQEPEAPEEFVMTSSKKGKKKGKSQSLSLYDFTPEPHAEIELVSPRVVETKTGDKPAEDQFPEYVVSGSKKGKKKGKSSQSMSLDDFNASEPQVESTEAPTNRAISEPDVENQTSDKPADVEFPEFVVPGSKKGKKKGKKSQSFSLDDFPEPQVESAEPSTSRDISEPTTDLEGIDKPAEDDAQEFVVPGSKKGNKKGKKSQTLEPETPPPETVTELGLTTSEQGTVSKEPTSSGDEAIKDSKKTGYFSSALFGAAAAGAALFGYNSAKKEISEPETPKEITEDSESKKVVIEPEMEVDRSALPAEPTLKEEEPSTLPDGLTAGYKDDQLSLAKQLQEEFNRKSSKKDKKSKRQSLPSTPDRQPSRSRATGNVSESSARARSLSIGPSDTRAAVSPGSGERKSVYSEDQLELARQLKEEFGSGSKNSSKKDKKKRTSRSGGRDESPFDEAVESPRPIPAEIVEETPMSEVPEPVLARDGLEAGYQEDQLSLARQLQAEFGKKSSKKDKKSRSKSRTPQDQELAGDYFGDTSRGIVTEPLPIAEPITASEPIQSPETTFDGLAVGYSEDQLELARQLKEEFGSGSKKGKKDKKDKKRQTLLRSTTDDDLSSDPYARDADESNLQTPQPELEDIAVRDTQVVEPEDEFATVSKKSKKDKKGKKRESILRSNTEDDFSSDAPPRDAVESQTPDATEDLQAPDESSAIADDAFPPFTKKSKKDKKGKKRESVLKESADDDFSSDTATRDIDTARNVAEQTPVESRAVVEDEEFSLPGKKSKKDKKERQSMLAQEETLVQPNLEEPLTSGVELIDPSIEPITESFDGNEFSMKKPKKDKKKRQSLLRSSTFDEVDQPTTDAKDIKEESGSRDLVVDGAQQAPETTLSAEQDDGFATTSNKSKKEKKRKSLLTADVETAPSFSTEPTLVPEPTFETEPRTQIPEAEPSFSDATNLDKELGPAPAADNPEEQFQEFALTKKSKKDKKKRKESTKLDDEDASGYSTSLDPFSVPKDLENVEATPIVEIASSEIPTESTLDESLPKELLDTKEDDWAVPEKKSKKDKKKKRDSVQVDPVEPSMTSDPVESEETAREIIESIPAKDVTIVESVREQSLQPESVPLPSTSSTEASEEPTEEWGPFSIKKSKKDKKKKRDSLKDISAGPSTISTPLEQVEESLKSPEEIPLPTQEAGETNELVEPVETEFTPLIATGLGAGVGAAIAAALASSSASVPETSQEPEDDWSAPTKKSKKDKKRKSGLSTPIEETHVVEPEAEPSIESSAQQPEPETMSTESKEIVEDPIERWSLPSKKSKDKKRKSGLSTPIEESIPVEPEQTLETIAQQQELEPTFTETKEIVEEPTEEWSLPSKKSKKDKKRKSGLSTPIEESILIEPEQSTEAIVQQETLDPTSTHTREIVEEPQEEWSLPSKKSKKDKKKQKPGSSTPFEEPVPVQPEPSLDAVDVTQEPTLDVPDIVTKKIVEEPEEQWALPGKKSKKDKKKQKSGASTQFEESVPLQPEVSLDTAGSTLEPELDLTSTATRDIVEEPEAQWALPGKKSKKDKNLKSNVPTTFDEILSKQHEAPSSFAAEEAKETVIEKTQPAEILEAVAEPAEEWAMPGKKSKKDKKKPKSGSTTPFEDLPIAEHIQTSKAIDRELQQAPSEDAVAEIGEPNDNEWALPSKTSKKDREKQKSGSTTPFEDLPAAEPVQSSETIDPESQEVPSQVLIPETFETNDNEWALPGKKSKRDKKKQKSGLSTPAERLPAPDIQPTVLIEQVAEPFTSDAIREIVSESQEDEWSLPQQKSKKDKKNRKSGLSTPVEEETFEHQTRSLDEAALPAAEILDVISAPGPKEEVVEETIQDIPPPPTVGTVPQYVTDKKLAAPQFHDTAASSSREIVEEPIEEDNWGSFVTKKSKKDKKRKSGLSTPAEQAVVTEEPITNDALQLVEPSTSTHHEVFETPFAEKSTKLHHSQDVEADLREAVKQAFDEPAGGDEGAQPKDADPIDELFTVTRKKSKKDKKGKKSRVGSESGPSTSQPTELPTTAERSLDITTASAAPFEPEDFVSSPVQFEEGPSRQFETTAKAGRSVTPIEDHHEDIGDTGGSLSRSSSKKEKRKRQLTRPVEGSTSVRAPLTSWADEVEEAEVVRPVPVIEDIAKDESLSHIARTTEPSPIDDFIRPSKKGKKGKKVGSAEPTPTSDSFRSPVSDHSRAASSDEHSVFPGLAAAGAAIAGGAALLSKVGESSEELTRPTPVRKLSKKQQRKQSIDKRDPTKTGIFDDDALWEGDKPRAYEGDDPADNDDGFWSPKEEEYISSRKPVEVARSTTPPPEIVGKSFNPKDENYRLHQADVLDSAYLPVTPGPSRSPEPSHLKDIPFDESPLILERHISPTPIGFSDEPSNDRSVSPEEKRTEHSKSPFRSSRFSQIGFSDLPTLEEEEQPTAEHRHNHHTHEDVNRDSAFVGGSPIPAQRGFADHHEHVRDSGVHLRDPSPPEPRAVSSSDAAIARLSWPPLDEDTETVDLHRSQRPKQESGAKPKTHHEERRSTESHDSPTLPRGDKATDFYRSQRATGPSKHGEESGSRDLLPSRNPKEEKHSDLRRTPTIHGGKESIVKQRLRQFQSNSQEEFAVKQRVERTPSPGVSRSTSKEDKYSALATSKPKAQTPRGFNDLEAGAVVAGAALGFAAARKLSAEQRPPSAASQRSLSNINRLRTPDIKRPESGASNRSGTPPLRRSDRQRSGDLRSLSQQSKPDLAKEAELAAAITSTATPTNPQANEGRVRAKDMADVYDGFGEGRMGSPRSPTRPHSMRRRQSMQVLDLESKVEQLVAENRVLAEQKAQVERTAQSGTQVSSALVDKDAEIDSLKRTLDWLQNEVSRLTEVNDGLTSANSTIARQHSDRYGILEQEHGQATRELQEARSAHSNLSSGMEGIVRNEVQNAVADKDREIAELRVELDAAKEQIREMQRQILASKANDTEFLTVRDEDYFDNACQQLCQHVQQWVLRFSKFSDMRACRLTSEINNDKTIDRLDNAILDGSDVDNYLSDRVKRRDVFMSMTMTMVWEFIFTRYLFGMDREQRQKLKSLEKTLSEVGPASAVHSWRATTLTLLAKREAFAQQREQDTQAVVHAIIETLSEILPPPSHLEGQIEEQLTRVMKSAVDLSIEMRCQRAEYMMLPPLQPEYDANGDLTSKVIFNAALMNERSGETVSNEDLEDQKVVVRIVLFPLVVKKGDDSGEGEEEIVVCPAQVLVAKPKKTVRMAGTEQDNRSRVSMQSNFPMGDGDNVI